MAAIYRVGERVDGLYDENTDDMWYPGRIRCVHAGEAETDSADGPTFEVLYDDGEVETHVRPEFLRQHVPGTICIGTRVLCRYDGGEEYYPGQVSDVQENGRYTIAYDDGEVEEDVPLAHILEPKEEEKEGEGEAVEDDAADEEEQEKASDDAEPEQQQQQEDEDENEEGDADMEEAQDSPNNPADDPFSGADFAQENEESVNGDDKSDEPVTTEPSEQLDHPTSEQPKHNEAFPPTRQNEGLPDPTPAGVSAERAYIIQSLQLLEKRLGDSASTKSVLSTLVKQMRAYPQVTADLVHEHGGERLIIDALTFHQSHAVIQCYGFVLLRRLCFLCVKSTHYLLRNGIVELVIQAMNAFAEDAILQASACGALAVFTRVQSGLNILIEYQVAQLVLSTLIYHKTYSVHTRQVHYYACEVLLELCELDDLQTLNLLCGEQEEDLTGDMAPISLLLFLLRQGLSLDDKKACCAVGSLLMCLAASGKRAAALILGLNGIAELSTVMARYPTEPSIQKYSAAASKQIALCTVRQSPTKRIKDTATEILREAESLENTPTDRQPVKKSSLRGRSTSIGKRKSNPATGYGAPSYPRGAAYTSSTPYRHAQGFSKAPSPYGQGGSCFGGDTSTFGYPARDFPATAPQQPSSLVILDGSLGMDSGFGSTNKRKQLSKEDRQSELFDAYGIQGVPSAANGRPYGTKRAQLRAHLASAESAWAPQQHASSSSIPYSSRSDYMDHGPAYSHRDFMSSRQNRWDDNDEPHHTAVYEPEVRQPRGAKRKKKNPAPRTAFQVKIENENQLRVSRETRSPYPSPQRLGVATKRAAKARQKRITGAGYSTLTGRSNNTSSESLNDYATQLFQDNVSRAGSGVPTSSKLTPREKEEIRERERLSFAEKLHKMIDKAKSTLANGSTTPVPSIDHTSRQKASASSKTARKTREAPSDDKRPLSKKSRPVVSSTPKYTPKEILSPRESTETRPAKPTSGASKRQAGASEGHQTPSGHQAPMVARAKQVASRPVVPPKVTSEQKPRSVVKSNKSATAKSADKKEVEGVTGSVTTAVAAEVIPPSTPATDEPLQVDSDAVAVNASPETVDEAPAPTDMTPTQQVEPEISSSNEAVAVAVESVPSELPTELVDPVDHEDNLPSNAPEQEITAAEAAIPLAPSETETVTSPVDAPLPLQEESVPHAATEVNVEAATDVPEASVEAQETSVPPLEEPSALPDPAEDQPSGGSATVDAMYGDAYNEFDDNGGDDEDIAAEAGADAEDTQMQDTGASDPPNDAPLQESKSGEALYDDGYDEFDEDDTPNAEDTEADEAPTAEAEEANPEPETTDETSSVSVVGESEPAAGEIEAESEQVSAENDDPPDAPVENNSNAEVEAEAESAVQDSDVDDNTGGGKTESAVVEPEESHEMQPDAADVAQEAPSDPDVLASNDEEEQNDSTPPILEGESVPDPTDESNLESDVGNEPVATALDGDTGGNDTSDDLVDAEGATLEEEASPEADTTTSVAEPTVAENEAENTETGIQSAAAEEEEASATDIQGEAADSVDATSEEVQADPRPVQQDEDNSTEVTEAATTEGLEANESAPLTEQDVEQDKTLSADASVVSIQSVAYDEDNFDDEESHQQADPSEEASEVTPVSPPVEETVEPEDQAADLVDPQQEQDGETSQVADAEVDANDVAPAANNKEEDSKGLTANSSDLSVQSAAYEDDDFDDGAHEEVAQEDHVETEVQTPDQQPSVDGDTEAGEPVALPETAPPTPEVESEALSEPVASGAEDVDNTAPSESSKGNADEPLDTETTDEALVTETTDEPSELQPIEPSESTAASEPGAVADVPADEVIVLQVEAAEDQQTVDDVDTRYDASRMENSGEDANGDDTKLDATPEVPVEGTDLLPGSDESSTAPSEPTDTTDASQPPEITIPTDELTQEEAPEQPDDSAQPATYDEDDFDNGGEEEQISPSLTTQDSDLVVDEQKAEDLKDDVSDVLQSSEQTTDEPVDSPATNGVDEPGVVSSEPELQAEEQQEQSAAESESIPTTEDETSANGAVAGEVGMETRSEPESAVASSEEAGDPVAANDDATPNSPIDEGGDIAVEVPSPEPETALSTEPEHQPDEQVSGEEGPTSAQDNADEVVVPESAAGHAPADEAPESEPQSTILDEQNEAEVTVETPADEYEPDVADDGVTEQAPDSTQASDELAEDSPESDQSPVDATATADTSVEPSGEATQEENQYGDADFDEVENDAAALKETASDSALAGDGPAEIEENAAPEIPATASPLPIDISQSEENTEVVYDDPEFQTEEAEADPTATFASDDAMMNQDPPEPAEAPADIAGDHDEGANDQPADDATPEAVSDNPSDDIVNASDAGTQDEPLESSPDATTYMEDFPSDTLPESNEEVPSEEDAANSDGNAVADSESLVIKSAASDVPAQGAEPFADVDEVPDASPSSEGYDEGFDEDTATPVVDPSDPVDSTPVAEDTAANADVEVSTTLETAQDAVVAESDQLIEGEIDPSPESVAEDGQEVKPEDCDAAKSVEVEPTEAPMESEVVDPEAAELEAKPETSEMEITDPEAAAESNEVGTVSVELEPTGVEADVVNDEFSKTEERESPPPELETVEPEADAAEEAEAVEPEAVAPEASEAESLEADAPQEPEAIEPEAVATEGPEAVESEIVSAAEPEGVEPEAVSSQEPEADEHEPVAPEVVESEIASAAEPEAIESEAVSAEEPERVEPEALVIPEPSAVESEAVSVAPESGESEVVQSELAEANAGEVETTETAALEGETMEAVAPEPDVHESESVDAKDSVVEATESEAVSEDAAQSEDIETVSTTADSAPASESTLENATTDTPLDEPAAPEASHEDLPPEASEVPDVADPVVGNSEDLPTEAVAKDEEEVVEERNDPISVNDDEAKENAADEVEASNEEIVADAPQSGDNSASSPIEAPVSEDPTDVIAAENPDHTEAEGELEADPPSDTQQESVDDPVYTDDLDADGDEGATEVIRNTGEVVSSDTSETKEEPISEAASPDPAESVDLAPEDQTPTEPDDYYADPPEDEQPATALVDTTPAEYIQGEAVEEEAPSTETPREEPEQQADAVDVPESSENMAVEVVESPPDEIAIESPGVAASEGPATEDQYDDEDAYNEFEDQDNEAAAPSVEIPAPSAAVTEAPATEDEYEDYENEDYGEEEKPAADPVPPPTSTRSDPPPSAREEEIEEVADEPEEAEEEEEAYANDQDDYNNEFEDDDAPASPPKASSPKKDKPVEASADEYEDDAEEDYAEDEEVEESSPRPAAKSTAAAQPAASHSDDEMEEELGSDYADSDG